MHAPAHLVAYVLPLVAEHLNHMHGQPTPRAVRRLAVRLEPADIVLWEALVEADASGRPPMPASRPARPWLDMAENLDASRERPKPLLTGHMLIDLGLKPGKAMGTLLHQAYEAQLDGAFEDEDQAIAWARAHVAKV
jgi:tRNA nucleotidyltransferase (CCA-adding enzyme)